MTAFAGVLYPSALQISDIASLMLEPLKERAQGEMRIISFRNFQMGTLGPGYACNAKKEIHLTLDGTIYNLEELRKDFLLSTESTQEETLVALYEKIGIEFLKTLNGEFALSLFDQKQNTLYLAKDPVGKHPLYWHQDKKYFIFGSALKALLSSGLISQPPSIEAISTYLFFGFFPQDLTPVKDVNKLLPSHYLEFSPQRGVQIVPYWSYSFFFEKRLNLHKSQIVTKINDLLEKSVASRTPRKGPLGCFVSGGLGSATTAFYVTKHASNHPVKGFTAAFKDYNEDDLAAADLACESLEMPHEGSLITPELFLNDYPKILWHLDEPIADPNVMSTWMLSKLASGYSHYTYSGMGSDELLAGHSRYSLAERAPSYINRAQLIPRPILQNIMIPVLSVIYPPAAFNLTRLLKTNPLQFEFLRHNAVFNESALREVSPRLAHAFDPDTFLHKFHHLSRIHSTTSSLLYFDMKTRLPDCFIHQYERKTRAFKLKWETPFLDKDLLEFTAQLAEPESLSERETASYLKPLVRDLFPPEFINRPKKTRHHFLSGWIDHPDVEDVFKFLLNGSLVEAGLISEQWLSEALQTKTTMKNAFQQIYSILTLELWFKLFINRIPSDTPPDATIREIMQQK
ncbi:MAG: asparagine synthetase B family protein [Parachlamydiaceae bacterium]